MKISKFTASLLASALIMGLALAHEPTEAQAARQITMQNKARYPISVALLIPSSRGWRVHGWYKVAPYSYKTVRFDAGVENWFGFYAKAQNIAWYGKGREPTITVVSNAMNHEFRQTPYGSNQRRVKVRIQRGNSVAFNRWYD